MLLIDFQALLYAVFNRELVSTVLGVCLLLGISVNKFSVVDMVQKDPQSSQKYSKASQSIPKYPKVFSKYPKVFSKYSQSLPKYPKVESFVIRDVIDIKDIISNDNKSSNGNTSTNGN